MPLALIVSPIRSWPLDQGNRARIVTIGTMLKERGYTVHFLLSELEGGPSSSEREVMSQQWDLVRTVPYRHERHQAYADAWGGDDWYDPALDAVIRELSTTWNYDLCLVNYAWYSAAFEALPEETVRIIDTHDAFGDRHKRLYASGTTPAWYYTRPEDEGLCLDRADIVLSIQDEEQAWFASLTDQPVRTVGHVTPTLFLPPRRHRGSRLRGGYMASGNPSNQKSIRALIRSWAATPFLAQNVELHVAGPICDTLDSVPNFVTRHGFIDQPQDFYAENDFSVNPNIGGSGLKIKSVEALSFGQPLFATVEGMLGICSLHKPYVLQNVETMTAEMAKAIASDPELDAARTWARETCIAYRQQHIAAFDGVLDMARDLRAQRRNTGKA